MLRPAVNHPSTDDDGNNCDLYQPTLNLNMMTKSCIVPCQGVIVSQDSYCESVEDVSLGQLKWFDANSPSRSPSVSMSDESSEYDHDSV